MTEEPRKKSKKQNGKLAAENLEEEIEIKPEVFI